MRKGDVFYLEEKRDRLIQYDFMKSAIKRQIMNCINIEHYNAGIYVVTKQKINNITDTIKEIISEMSLNDYLVDDRTPFVITPNEATIYFKKGSRIRIVPATECARGCKYNDIIYDHMIEDEIIDNIVIPSYIPYMRLELNWVNKDRIIFKTVECEM